MRWRFQDDGRRYRANLRGQILPGLPLDAMRVPLGPSVTRPGAQGPAQRIQQGRGHHCDPGDRDRSREVSSWATSWIRAAPTAC